MDVSTEPHPRNACAGAFSDWLEVNLLPECNGSCSWCVERIGYHPTHRATWQEIADAAVNTGAHNVILLGGEPLLYEHLTELVKSLCWHGRRVWLTTNGALLHNRVGMLALEGVAGVNVSIHDCDLRGNEAITGVPLDRDKLKRAVGHLVNGGGRVRLNCNLITGHIDSEVRVHEYIAFAKDIGATHVRFAELKLDGGRFVNATELFGGRHGTNDDPFINGCNQDTVIDGMPVNIRQMCGLQTPRRQRPINPMQRSSKVLYYDGNLYEGWQCPGGLDRRAIGGLLRQVSEGRTSVDNAARLLE